MCQSTRHGPGSLLFDTRSFFLCDADFSEVSRQNFQTEERILSCTSNDTSQEGRYRFESSNKEEKLMSSESYLNHKSSSCVTVVRLSVLRISSQDQFKDTTV